jgi:lipopolysaccharide biosynthesis regulator YciM
MFSRVFAVVVIATLGWVGGLALAQNATQQTNPKISDKVSNSLWQNLTQSQKKALAPLAPHWAQISPAQRNKWLAMSNNFDNLSPREQATLHNRMADWASLSPQQRAQARLNFNETKTLGADQKKSQWEAYQALSQDDRKKLAAQQTTKIQGAATASQPASPQKVIPLQGKSPLTESVSKTTPVIVIDKKTLLPTTVAIPEGT